MHILYLDESGGPNSWGEQRNFVLGGIAVHEGQIYSLTNDINSLQKKYFPDISIPIEFHTRSIRQGHGPHFGQYNFETRCKIIDEVYDIMAKYVFPNIITYASVMDISVVENTAQVTNDCFEDVCQHFNLFLYNQYRKYTPTKGLLIIDRGREKEYLGCFAKFKQSREVEVFLGNIVDIPYFAACSETRMLQLADFVANAVFRYYEQGITEQFDKIRHQFYRGPLRYPVAGLNHLTKDEACQCCVCK